MWILCLSIHPPDSEILISVLYSKLTFILKEDFGPMGNSPVFFFILSPGETLTTLSLVQKWLDTRNVTFLAHVEYSSLCGGCGRTDSSLSPLSVNLPQILEWISLDNSLKAAGVLFPTSLFLSTKRSANGSCCSYAAEGGVR